MRFALTKLVLTLETVYFVVLLSRSTINAKHDYSFFSFLPRPLCFGSLTVILAGIIRSPFYKKIYPK